jgi:hypothetical protein
LIVVQSGRDSKLLKKMIETRVNIDWMIHFISLVNGVPNFLEKINSQDHNLVYVYNEIIGSLDLRNALAPPQCEGIRYYPESDALGM